MPVTSAVSQSEESKFSGVRQLAPARSEKRLVAEAKQGRAGAFGELCRPYAKTLLPRVHRITRNCEDAEDALQDSFLRAFVHIRDFNGTSSFSTWLTRIAINSALMILRKRRNLSEISTVDDETQECWDVPDGLPSPEARCAQRERDEILRSAVEKLRPSIRTVLQLRQLQEHSIKETASVLDISVAAAKARLFQARAALRKSSALRRIAQASREPAA
jgi:RNA polymerase sigma factor (sigma-70 family)